MNFNEYLSVLSQAFSQNGLSSLITEDAAKKLYCLSDILIQTNKTFNLTAITDEKEIILKHFVDCASALEYISDSSTVIDVGCGAGFPSIPLAILNKTLNITSLDSTSKKIGFINSTVKELCLDNITGICGRAEEMAESKRESFDVCISRAVARLNVLSEICIPLVK